MNIKSVYYRFTFVVESLVYFGRLLQGGGG